MGLKERHAYAAYLAEFGPLLNEAAGEVRWDAMSSHDHYLHMLAKYEAHLVWRFDSVYRPDELIAKGVPVENDRCGQRGGARAT